MQERDVVRAGNTRLRRRKRKVFYRKSLLVLFLFVFVTGGLIFLSWRPFLAVKEVSIAGIRALPKSDIQSDVASVLRERYIFAFPKSNIFLVPKRDIERTLRAEFPRIETIDVSIDTRRILHVALTEREGKFLWCGATMHSVEDTADCYYMDSTGRIFDKAPYFSAENIYFTFYGSITDEIDGQILDEHYLSLTEFTTLETFIESLDNSSVASFACEEKEDEFVLYLGKTMGENMPYMTWKRSADLAHLKSNIDSALATEPFKTRFHTELSNLEYIDLRFENKVYYKFKPTF